MNGVNVTKCDGIGEKIECDTLEDRGRKLQNGDFYESLSSRESDTVEEERDRGGGQNVHQSSE